jgi:hypothetical protein
MAATSPTITRAKASDPLSAVEAAANGGVAFAGAIVGAAGDEGGIVALARVATGATAGATGETAGAAGAMGGAEGLPIEAAAIATGLAGFGLVSANGRVVGAGGEVDDELEGAAFIDEGPAHETASHEIPTASKVASKEILDIL